MCPIRVLIVDDSVLVRSLISRALAEDGRVKVAGVAASGTIALERIPQVNPDLVVLDLEMPEMDGLATLRAIRASYPELPVIMFSSHTERGAAVTMDALFLGANDYVTKPAGQPGADATQEIVRRELLPRILGLTERKTQAAAVQPSRSGAGESELAGGLRSGRFDVLAIGASTGGPNALAGILEALPAEYPLPVLIVQHMPPLFTGFFCERLSRNVPMPVREAREGERLEPGQVLLAPGDAHLGVERRGTAVFTLLSSTPPENSCRPAVDVLFRSVAEVFGPRALALILTGMGNDGLRGCEQLAQCGAEIWAQDQASSVVWGMPGAVVNAGLARRILPLNEMAAALQQAACEPAGCGDGGEAGA